MLELSSLHWNLLELSSPHSSSLRSIRVRYASLEFASLHSLLWNDLSHVAKNTDQAGAQQQAASAPTVAAAAAAAADAAAASAPAPVAPQRTAPLLHATPSPPAAS